MPKKLKVLLYISTIYGGGAERAMVNLACSLAEKGHKVILVTNSINEEWDYPVSDGVKHLCMESDSVQVSRIKRNISRISKLSKICRAEKPEVAISFSCEPNFRLLVAPVGRNVKKIISVRNAPEILFSSVLDKLIAKYLYRRCDGIVLQTKDAQNWYPNGVKRKSCVIYNVVNSDFYALPDRSGLQPNTVVSVGRLVPQKNFGGLIRAFRLVLNAIPEAKLFIYGTGALYEELNTLIVQTHLESAVRLMGQTADVISALSSASLFVLNSDWEGLPNALMEAMALGMPCIATDCIGGGPRELFGEENKDYLVKCRDEKMLADKIIDVLASDQAKEKNALACKKRAEAFQTEKIGAQWEEYIYKVCNIQSSQVLK